MKKSLTDTVKNYDTRERIEALRRELHNKIDELFDRIKNCEVHNPEPITIIKDMSDKNKWLSSDELSKKLGISKSTLFRKVHEGNLPKPTYFGLRLPRWRMTDIEKFIGLEME